MAIAVDDDFEGLVGSTVEATDQASSVLANDTSLSAGSTVELVYDAAYGDLNLNPDGTFTYQIYDDPALFASRTERFTFDQFAYRVNDPVTGESNIAFVDLYFQGTNPMAIQDTYTVTGSSLSVGVPADALVGPGVVYNPEGVLENDRSNVNNDQPTQDPLTQNYISGVQLDPFSTAAYGYVTLAGNGAFTYTLYDEYIDNPPEVDGFNYIIQNGNGLTDRGYVLLEFA